MKFIAAILCISVFAIPAFSQTPLKARVAISQYETGGILKTRTQTVSLSLNPTGKFSVSDTAPAATPFPPECVRTDPRSQPQLGTTVEGTVSAEPDGRYEIRLVITVRSAAGCRMVGTMNIPVIANRIMNKEAFVANGETLSVPIGSRAGGDSLGVEVTLTPEK